LPSLRHGVPPQHRRCRPFPRKPRLSPYLSHRPPLRSP
jgi:hypothetical protein